jgi:hypothetical protein
LPFYITSKRRKKLEDRGFGGESKEDDENSRKEK